MALEAPLQTLANLPRTGAPSLRAFCAKMGFQQRRSLGILLSRPTTRLGSVLHLISDRRHNPARIGRATGCGRGDLESQLVSRSDRGASRDLRVEVCPRRKSRGVAPQLRTGGSIPYLQHGISRASSSSRARGQIKPRHGQPGGQVQLQYWVTAVVPPTAHDHAR